MSAEKKEMRVLLSLPPDSIPDAIVRGEFIEREPPLRDSLRAAAASAYDLFGRVEDLSREIKDKTKLAAAALPHVERAAAQLGRAIESSRSRRASLDKELEQLVVGDGRDAVGLEIRAHLKSSKTPATDVMNAARTGDRRTVAAALSAPPYLSGLSETQRQQVHDVARRALEPERYGLLSDLDSTITRLERANDVFLERTSTLIRRWRSNDDALIATQLGGAA